MAAQGGLGRGQLEGVEHPQAIHPQALGGAHPQMQKVIRSAGTEAGQAQPPAIACQRRGPHLHHRAILKLQLHPLTSEGLFGFEFHQRFLRLTGPHGGGEAARRW